MNKLKSFIIGLIAYGAFAPSALAQDTSTPLGEVSNFGELVSLVWGFGSQVVLGLAVFLVVLGAFFYVASGGNDERISQGKDLIFGSLIAIIIVMTSGVLIRTLHKPTEGTTGSLTEIPAVIQNATNILVGIIGTFSILMFIYAGILYMLARGNEDRIDKARRAFRYAAYGLILALIAFTAVNAVINFFI